MGGYINQFRPRLHLTVDEAARRFGVSAQTLTVAIRRRELHAARVAHRFWVTATAVERYLGKRRVRERAA